MLDPGWLPAGFTMGAQRPVSLAGASTTVSATGPGSASIEFRFSYSATPLDQSDGGGTVIGSATVDGEPAIVEGPPPGPPGQFVGVYWKANATDLLSVRGQGIPETTVLDAARHLVFQAPKVVSLPVAPGRVVDGAAVSERAKRAAHKPDVRAVAKSPRGPRSQRSFAPRASTTLECRIGWWRTRGRPCGRCCCPDRHTPDRLAPATSSFSPGRHRGRWSPPSRFPVQPTVRGSLPSPTAPEGPERVAPQGALASRSGCSRAPSRRVPSAKQHRTGAFLHQAGSRRSSRS